MKGSVLGALAAPLLLAFATGAPDGSGWPDFDAQVASAKAAMMAEPQAALVAARAAEGLARSRPASVQRAKASATAGWLEGEALLRVNKPAEAAPVIEAALAQARQVAPGTKLEGDLLKARGALATAQGRVQPALADLQSAFRVYQHADVARSEAIVLQDIGTLYSDARDYEHTISYYKQSSEVYKSDPAISLVAHNNIGGAYLGQKKYPEALHEFELALKNAQDMKSGAMLTRVLSNLAQAQTRMSRFDKADAALKRAFQVADTDPGAKTWKPLIWGMEAQLQEKRGRLPAARAALEQAFAGQDLKKTELQFSEFHDTAWRVYSALGEPALALAHLAAYKRLDDQARDVAASTNTALMGAQFDFANQNLSIERLRAQALQRDVALARSRAKAQATLLRTVVASAGALLVLGLFTLLAMRRSRNAIRGVNARLEVSNGALERALKAKSQFLATTSHEIRTPLNGVLGMTQVLLADRSLTPAVRGRVELVHGAGETMRALVDDILDLAKMETGRISVQKRPMDLARLVDDLVRLWRAEAQNKGLSLTLDAPDAPRMIVEDEGRLRQVLFNLMSNAIKFTDAGGVTLRIRPEGADLVFAVVDTGVGIAAADLERVFEPFTQVDGGTTRRHGGTGLGLAICRDVAHALGGEVTLESRPGAGSSFTVTLPWTVAQPAGTPARPDDPEGGSPPVSALADARWLVVEPNPLARSVLRAVLAPRVAAVEVAPDAAKAEQVLADGGWTHLLVATEALGAEPEAATAALRGLRAASGDLPISLLATQPSAELSSALLRAGVAQLLTRPIAPEALLAALDAAVRSPAAAQLPTEPAEAAAA